MTGADSTEQRLRSALEVVPSSDALGWLDGRVQQLIARHGEPTAKRGLSWRWFLRPLPLIVAFLLLAGGAAAALTLMERLATTSGPGWAAAWELAEVIDQTQSDQGYTVTLERAYADVNQVVTFVTVTADDPGLPEAGEGGSVWFNGGLRDASGRALEAPLSTMRVENALSASVGMWVDPTPQAGTYVLEISSIEVLPADFDAETLPAPTTGTWRFEFELPAPAGVVVEPAATASHDGLTVELAELRVAPSMIAGRMYLTVDGAPAPVWSATIAEVLHDGEKISTDNNADFLAIPLREEGATGVEFRTAFGAELASGTWELRISQITFPENFDPLTGESDDEWAPRDGDWVLTVEVP
jgi:hypothetical protein